LKRQEKRIGIAPEAREAVCIAAVEMYRCLSVIFNCGGLHCEICHSGVRTVSDLCEAFEGFGEQVLVCGEKDLEIRGVLR
jgi:hypothetical protein